MGNRTREAGSSNAGESGTGSVKDIQAHVRHSKADATAQRVHAGVAGECATLAPLRSAPTPVPETTPRKFLLIRILLFPALLINYDYWKCLRDIGTEGVNKNEICTG